MGKSQKKHDKRWKKKGGSEKNTNREGEEGDIQARDGGNSIGEGKQEGGKTCGEADIVKKNRGRRGSLTPRNAGSTWGVGGG